MRSVTAVGRMEGAEEERVRAADQRDVGTVERRAHPCTDRRRPMRSAPSVDLDVLGAVAVRLLDTERQHVTVDRKERAVDPARLRRMANSITTSPTG